MNLTTRTLLALALGLCLGSAQALSLKDSETLDKLDQLDRGDQQAVLKQAKQAAKDWKFDEAERLLKQAKVMAYNPAAVKEVESLIATNKQAKADKEKEEQARQSAEEVRKVREKIRAIAAMGNQSSGTSSSGGSNCDRISDYGLNQYCKTGQCSFNEQKLNYFCERVNDEYDAAGYLRSNYSGQAGNNLAGFAYTGTMAYNEGISNDAVYASQSYSGSFSSRKRWIIYYLNGYVLK